MLDKTVCELFAGVGGFRLGLSRSSDDWDFVWANQWEPGKKVQHAFNCYCNHFGENDKHTNKDISNYPLNKIPEHNLLVGGFPCQDYSVARTGATGIEGKKGVLWWSIFKIIEDKKPPFVILENVDRLLKSPSKQRGRDFAIMLASLNKLEYSVEWRVINAADYGFAQRRRRVFIFAYKNTTNYYSNTSKYINNPECIFNNIGFFSHIFRTSAIAHKDIKEKEFSTEDLVEISDNFSYKFLNSGFMTDGKIFTCETTPIYETPVPLSEILVDDAGDKYYLGEKLEKWIYLKGSKKIERTSKEGFSYTFSEGPIAFPDPIDKPARTMLTSESSVNRSTHVIKDPTTNQLRLLTPVEAERIQGFEDDWTNTGMPEKFRYFCMGNALVVGLITRMGDYLNSIFAKEISFNENSDIEKSQKAI